MAFERLPPKQIFVTERQEWVKCPGMMRANDIIYNAFVNIEEEARAGKAVELQVRLFDSEDLVCFDSERALFALDIVSTSIGSNDN